MFKKLIFFVIAGAMIFSLGACKPKENAVVQVAGTDVIQYYDDQGNLITDGTEPSATLSPAASKVILDPSNPGAVPPDYKINKVYTTDVTFKIADESFDMSKDAIGQYIQDKFKCKFDIKVMPAEKIILLAAQDQLPDFFHLDLSGTTYSQLDRVDQKYLYHIDRNALDQYPLLKRYFTSYQSLNAFSDISYDNKYVGLPYSTSTYSPVTDLPVSLYYRKDWAAKVGYDIPIDTIDKAYTLMKKFREEDPDGNGFKDTYGFSGGLWAFEYITWIDINSWVKETNPNSEFNGKYVPGFLNTKMFDAIVWWNRMLKEQIMPADFNLQPIMGQFIADKAGVSYGNSGDYWMWEFLINRFDPSHKNLYPTLPKINGRIQTVQDVVSEFPPLKPDENSNPRFPPRIQTTITAISSKAGKNQDEITRMFDFYEWMMTQEGTDFINYGLKGRDYIVDSKGEIVQTLPDSSTTPGAMKKIWELYPSVQIANFTNSSGTPTKTKVSLYPVWITNRGIVTQAEKNKWTVPATIAINNIMTTTKLKHLDLFSITWYEDKLNRIIAQDGDKTIEQGWKDFLIECLDTKEGRTIINEVNVQIQAKGLGK